MNRTLGKSAFRNSRAKSLSLRDEEAEAVAGAGGENGVGGAAVAAGEIVRPLRCSSLRWPMTGWRLCGEVRA